MSTPAVPSHYPVWNAEPEEASLLAAEAHIDHLSDRAAEALDAAICRPLVFSEVESTLRRAIAIGNMEIASDWSAHIAPSPREARRILEGLGIPPEDRRKALVQAPVAAWGLALQNRIALVPPSDLQEGDEDMLAETLSMACCPRFYSFHDFALAIENPARHYWDATGLPHREDGPAVEWADGDGLYAIHGVWVSEATVMNPSSLDPATILSEPNAEKRRIMLDRRGIVDCLAELGAELIDEDQMTLISGSAVPRLLVRLATGEQYVVVVDGSATCPKNAGLPVRRYALRAPGRAGTVAEAMRAIEGPVVPAMQG